ncbi:uncharacterized protein AMSG_08572 [Thecamonas trahens ATCC 50062]|uniref:Phytanoyl-CoA dioxygenase n=1 Tax=Thecamonas trahens ATCC 50062 TaxID=461836 RepID=A0A0L0DKZ3_THETB|nr:hypothetical protein AMSG_08572 [Thecamonas trahens ATCC 50062]KNC52696.1 hypothetical protein AMSG_08572 [Thecamonas trahens ATCC 50062]|eukprot:XP_013755240.1 hypothetical protein AMSG_08572 [Thecamonas trahens ATCC 50062]
MTDSLWPTGYALIRNLLAPDVIPPLMDRLSTDSTDGAADDSSIDWAAYAAKRASVVGVAGAAADALGQWLVHPETLARVRTLLYGASELPHCPSCGACARILLINEQFVVKPPVDALGGRGEACTFGWHADGQYAESVTDDDDDADACRDTSCPRLAASGAFVSLWIALVEVSEENGSLVLASPLAADTLPPPTLLGSTPEYEDESLGVRTFVGDAGDAVVLSPDIIHCSTPNYSSCERPVYMVQLGTRSSPAPNALRVRIG